MPFAEKELSEDLRNVRIRKYLCLGGGIGILGLAIALFAMVFVRNDWPALILSAIGLFWSVALFYQYNRTRKLEALLIIAMKPQGPSEPEAMSGDDLPEEPGVDRQPVGSGRGGARGEP